MNDTRAMKELYFNEYWVFLSRNRFLTKTTYAIVANVGGKPVD